MNLLIGSTVIYHNAILWGSIALDAASDDDHGEVEEE